MNPPGVGLEPRKQIRLRVRTDLTIRPQAFEGRTFYVVKDPVRLRYYRFREPDYFLLRLMDGRRTMEQVRRAFERHFRPDRLPLERLEAFAHRLLTAGLASHESPHADQPLWDRRQRARRREWWGLVTNLLAIKVPLFDPDRLLGRLTPFVGWLFRTWSVMAGLACIAAAALLVGTHFDAFRGKLPAFHEFFRFRTVLYLWAALAVVKVLHEFGHGLSCKACGGEVHEMGVLFLCLSPCLYCQVSDAWVLPGKWKRIFIHAAGVYVELLVAAIATFIWWNSPGRAFLNHLSLSLMLVCGVSTLVFNANPLLRFDGYYVLSAWLESPNLGERSGRLLADTLLNACLGVVTPTPSGGSTSRRGLLLTYAVVSLLYRWAVTFGVLWFLYLFLKPYKLGAVGALLACAAAGSMVGRPLVQVVRALRRPGGLAGVRPLRVALSGTLTAAALAAFFLVPLPVSRVHRPGVVQLPSDALESVYVPAAAVLERLYVRGGQRVEKDDLVAEFRSRPLEDALEEARNQYDVRQVALRALRKQAGAGTDPAERARLEMALTVTAGECRLLSHEVAVYAAAARRLQVRAPRAGVVLGSPRPDVVGRLWDDHRVRPFCTVGQPGRLWALVPVPPADYQLLRSERPGDLPVTVHVHGAGGRAWNGRVTPLPVSEAKVVPPQLTTPAGGPLAVKPGSPPGAPEPLSPQYLVAVEFQDTDGSVHPGVTAEVLIRCRWRPAAWWVWRALASAFDLELM
jgi:putative peptide zinc metalloprotease protein